MFVPSETASKYLARSVSRRISLAFLRIAHLLGHDIGRQRLQQRDIPVVFAFGQCELFGVGQRDAAEPENDFERRHTGNAAQKVVFRAAERHPELIRDRLPCRIVHFVGGEQNAVQIKNYALYHTQSSFIEIANAFPFDETDRKNDRMFGNRFMPKLRKQHFHRQKSLLLGVLMDRRKAGVG